jgi:hypothetical protein
MVASTVSPARAVPCRVSCLVLHPTFSPLSLSLSLAFSRSPSTTIMTFFAVVTGLSIHILLWSPWHIIGPIAVPEGTPDSYGAYGTTQTCTAQGFFIQLSMCIPLYYVFLSCYSWVVIVYGNFNPKKYQWIEKYIHLIVHIFPIASSVYLLYIEAFNSTGLGQCWIASIPFGCGDNNGTTQISDVCERGPQDITKILIYFAGLPAVFYLLFPTIVMGSLCVVVWNKHKQLKEQTKQRNNSNNTNNTTTATATSTTVQQQQQQQQQHHQPTLISLSMVIKQSLVYVGVMYWIFIPQFIVSLISVIDNRKSFGLHLFNCIVTDSMGLWIALVYWYFSTNAAASGIVISFKNNIIIIKQHCGDMCDPSTINHEDEDDDNDNDEEKNEQEDVVVSKAFSLKSNKSSNNDNISTNSKHKQHQKMVKRYSFNIFDGTAPANGRFSDFVFDGDDDDEEYDEKESEYWAGCQNG